MGLVFMARKTLSQLIEEYRGSEETVNVAFGIRPSGMIHLGNMMSMALTAGLSREIGPHISNMSITVCDLDLPDPTDWKISKEGYAKHYKDLPSPDNDGSMVDYGVRNIKEFLDALTETPSFRYEIRTLTEVHRDLLFREGLKRVLDSPEAMRIIMPNSSEKSVLVFPLCERCGTSYVTHIGAQKGKKITYENGKIHTYCTNPDCDVDEYEVDVLDTSRDIAVHVFIDLLRDSMVKPYNHIHVFGGDYSEPHGTNRLLKIEKIEKIMEIASQGKRIPDFLIGPTVYAKTQGGLGLQKMSKSKSNGLDMDRLREFLGSRYPQRVYDFTMDVVKRGYQAIEYALVEERLLGN